MASDAWQETCLITISKEGAADIEFAGITETVDFDLGEKDIEGVVLTNGGRVTKWSPESDTTITFEAYPLQAGTKASVTSGTGFFDLLHEADTSNPISIANVHRNKTASNADNLYRVLVMWTDDTSITSAVTATASTKKAMRFGFANVHFTSVKPSFTDGILKFTVVGKVVPFDTAASANIQFESTDGTATEVLPAIAAYTTSNKFG